MPVQVRDAIERDAAAVSALWSELVGLPGAETVGGEPPERLVEKAVVRYTADDSGRIVVAEVDGTVVGCGFMSIGVATPLDEGRVVHLSHVKVAAGYGRQGVGSALVEATLTWAEQHGLDSVVTSVPTHDREVNRFLARLGMTPAASLRAASVAALRVRLPHHPSAAARQSGRMGRSVGQVVAARRYQRRVSGRTRVAVADRAAD